MRSLLFLLVLVFAMVVARASVTLGPPGAWVDLSPNVSIKPTPADAAAYGYDFFLLDRQINVREAENYEHNVYRISSENALQSGSRFTWSFDPAYETLVLHHLRVIRDGVVQERLREGLVQIIQQERDLDRHMLNGRLTALIILDDIRVGDVIDSASSRRGANPVFGGNYIDSFTTGWSVPVRHQRIRIVVPTGRSLNHRHKGDSALKLRTVGDHGETIHTWEGHDLPVISSEDQLPSWYAPYPFLQISEFESWGDVAAWAVPYYAIPDSLPVAVTDKALALIRGLSDDEEKAMALLKFVQQEIRYLGLELGPGTHRPNPPEQVLARRFGDCKDKALLFCTLMHAAGIEAYPALVNTSFREHIGDWAPSPYAFDHVIACVRLGSTLWWVDPTLSHQEGGARHRGLPEYGLALPVREGTAALTRVIPPEGARRMIEIDEQFDVSGFDDAARLTVVTRYTGLGAESMRGYLASTSIDDITRAYINYYAAGYPGLTSTDPISWRDEPATNTLTVEEHYSVPDLWKSEKDGTFRKATFYPQTISDYAVQPSTRVRTMPLHMSHPVTVRQTTRVNLHEDWNVDPVDTTVTEHAFRLTDKIIGAGRTVTMSYRWESLADHVPAGQVAAHVAAIDRVRGQLGYNLTYDHAIDASPAAGVPERFRFNWLPVVIILIAAAVVFYAGRYLWARPPLSPPPIPGPGEGNLVGLGGWLVLIGLGVVLRPILLGVELVTGFDHAFDLNSWEALSTPGAEGYQAMYAPLVAAEVAGNTLLFATSLLLVLLFFKRKRAFPITFVALMLFSLLFLAGDTWAVANLIEADQPATTAETPSAIGKLFVQCAIWVPYMLISRRVKLTFTR